MQNKKNKNKKNIEKIFEKVYDIIMSYDNRLTWALENKPEETYSEAFSKNLKSFKFVDTEIKKVASQNPEYISDILKIWEFCYKTLIPSIELKLRPQEETLACPYSMDRLLFDLNRLYESLDNPEVLNYGMVYLLFKHWNKRDWGMFRILPWFKERFETIELNKSKDYFYYFLPTGRVLGKADLNLLEYLIVGAGWGSSADRIVDMLNEHGFEDFESCPLLYYIATATTTKKAYFLNVDFYNSNVFETPSRVTVKTLVSTVEQLEKAGVHRLVPTDDDCSTELSVALASLEMEKLPPEDSLPEDFLPMLLKKGLKPELITNKGKNDSTFLLDLLMSSVLMDYFLDRLSGKNKDPILEDLLEQALSYGRFNSVYTCYGKGCSVHKCESTDNHLDCLSACKQIIDYYEDLKNQNRLPPIIKNHEYLKRITIQWEKLLKQETVKTFFAIREQERDDFSDESGNSVDDCVVII